MNQQNWKGLNVPSSFLFLKNETSNQKRDKKMEINIKREN